MASALKVRAEWLESGRGAREESATGTAAAPPSSIVWDMPITREEAQFGVEWGKLDEPARSQIRTMVESLVAQQKKSERKAKGKPDPKLGPPAPRSPH